MSAEDQPQQEQTYTPPEKGIALEPMPPPEAQPSPPPPPPAQPPEQTAP